MSEISLALPSIETLHHHLLRLADVQAVGLPDWLAPMRQDAAVHASRVALPGKGSENYRYTSLEDMAKHVYLGSAESSSDIDAPDLTPYDIEGLDAVRLVTINGMLDYGLSDDIAMLGEGVICCSLEEATLSHRTLIESHLGRLADSQMMLEGEGFVALNQVAMSGGLFLYVPASSKMSRPVHVLNLATKGVGPWAVHARNLVMVEDGAEGTLIEQFEAESQDLVYLRNTLTEMIVGEDAKFEHYCLQKESRSAFHISTLLTDQAEKADVHTHTVLLGGSIVRNSVSPTLSGTASHCLINGLYVARGKQVMDNAMRVHHSAPGCFSRQHYKGILCDQSRGVFSGRIVVDKPAQQTDAVQQSRSMLLSDDARAINRPQLEIYADDVKCTHGATTGQVDEEAVFYFRSRGLSEEIARGMLTYAFAAEGFGRMEQSSIKSWLAKDLIARLPGAEKLSIEV